MADKPPEITKPTTEELLKHAYEDERQHLEDPEVLAKDKADLWEDLQQRFYNAYRAELSAENPDNQLPQKDPPPTESKLARMFRRIRTTKARMDEIRRVQAIQSESGSAPPREREGLTPPEQNRKNWTAVVRFFRLIIAAVFHPNRLWRQLTTWTVVSAFVLLGIGSGIGVLSMTPPLFLVAKLCFIGSAILLWIKTAHWLITSKAAQLERMLLAFLILVCPAWS